MLDLGDWAYANFDTDLEIDLGKAVELSRLCRDRSARGGVYGDVDETWVATLAVLARGEGVNGMRPPAVFVLKMPWWLLRGVDTDTEAILYVYDVTELANQCFDRCPVVSNVKGDFEELVSWSIKQSELVEEESVLGIQQFSDVSRWSTVWVLRKLLVGVVSISFRCGPLKLLD